MRLSHPLVFPASLAAVLAIVVASPAPGAPGSAQEVTLSNQELKKLDRFEKHTLAKADQVFLKEQYRQARAEYDSFIVEFPRSKVIPYALYFMGDCHRQNGDLEKAIKAWVKLAEDEDYRREPLGAAAVNHLADYLVRQEKEAEAAKY